MRVVEIGLSWTPAFAKPTVRILELAQSLFEAREWVNVICIAKATPSHCLKLMSCPQFDPLFRPLGSPNLVPINRGERGRDRTGDSLLANSKSRFGWREGGGEEVAWRESVSRKSGPSTLAAVGQRLVGS